MTGIFALLFWYGYRAWGNGTGLYWVFYPGHFQPGYEGYMGQYVGYMSRSDLTLLVQALEDL